MQNAPKDYLEDASKAEETEIKKAVSVKPENGKTVVFDYCVENYYGVFVSVFPSSVDMRYTKTEIEDIYRALRLLDLSYNTHVTVFSVERFSDWCIHEAKRNKMFHAVTLERLKY